MDTRKSEVLRLCVNKVVFYLLIYLFIFKVLILFMFRERESKYEWRKGIERRRERIPSRL